MTTIVNQILLEKALIKLPMIIGNPKSKPPIPALIPVGRTTWLNGVKSGIYPKPVKLGERSVAWKVEDINLLLLRLGGLQ
jgi:prophage regulatory protein